jgi:hypothetical protein
VRQPPCGVNKILQYSAITGRANGTKYFDVISENNVLYVDYLIVLQSFIYTLRSRGTATNPFAIPAALQKSKNELHEFEQYIVCSLRNYEASFDNIRKKRKATFIKTQGMRNSVVQHC